MSGDIDGIVEELALIVKAIANQVEMPGMAAWADRLAGAVTELKRRENGEED